MNEGRPIPPIYFEQGDRVKFIEANQEQLVDITNRVFEELKADYEDTLKLGAVAKEDYCTIEIKMFQGLFEPGRSHFDAGYLSERMKLSKKEIKSVFQDRNAVLGGRFELTYYSYDEQKRCNYAILLAIQRYIKFLGAELMPVSDVPSSKKVSAKNEVSLKWNKSDLVSVKIFDALGKLMYFTKNINISEPTQVDVSNYASGLYFVRINNLNGFVTKKLIIE